VLPSMAGYPGDDPSPQSVAIIGRMTPEQKLRAAMRLCQSARALKAAAFRHRHPEWTDDQITRAVRDAFLFHHE
jgi:Rv0078B-related antitoxin